MKWQACAHCGGDFVATSSHPDQRFCNSTCAQRAQPRCLICNFIVRRDGSPCKICARKKQSVKVS